jgi:hypothetical protein
MVVLALAAFAVSLGSVAEATPVTCRTGLGCLNGTDFFDWTINYGPPFSPIPNNSTATSSLGVQVTVNFAEGGGGMRVDQGIGWTGNFTPGDELLWTDFDGPLNLNGFSQTLSGVGANIQTDQFGDFTALIQAFDAGGTLIGSFSENGTSTTSGDGSAIFIGLTNVPGIAFVTFSVPFCQTGGVGGCSADFAINQLDIVRGAVAPVAAPVPGTLLLLSSGLVIVGYLRRRRSP